MYELALVALIMFCVLGSAWIIADMVSPAVDRKAKQMKERQMNTNKRQKKTLEAMTPTELFRYKRSVRQKNLREMGLKGRVICLKTRSVLDEGTPISLLDKALGRD